MMSELISGNTNFNLDADQVDALPTTNVNLHLTAECNFFFGNYKQPTGSTDDILSTVVVNKNAILNANYKPATTAAILPVGINFAGSDEINTAVNGNSLGDVADFGDATNSAVAKDILDVVSLTLFNRKEKYLDSGRYDASIASEANDNTVAYSFNQARLHFVVQVAGSLADAEGANSNSVNGISSDLSNAVSRGDSDLYMARAFPSRLQDMISNSGAYDFNVLFTLVQNDALNDGESA
jgi:hypothetical protein